MPRFFTGDELGTLKSVRYSREGEKHEWKASAAILTTAGEAGKARAVQKLSVARNGADSTALLAAARADGSASVLRVEDDAATTVHEWTEPRLKSGQRYVGLAISNSGIFSCTSNGALRLTKLETQEAGSSSRTAALPTRLCDWRLSSNGDTFAYGGDEVELSVWNTERAFVRPADGSADPDSKKRKRGDQLLPGEVWRAKNLPNDGLALRQPVHNTSLTYLQPLPSSSQHHLVTGTHSGHVRRYDTRAARKPVANWAGIGKVSGVCTVEKGHSEHEVFVADRGCNLFALDLRNGRVIYGYKGLSGAVNSLAPAPGYIASTSQDRLLRFHSTFPPPPVAGAQQEKKGEVLDKLFMKSIPTVIVWDQVADVEVIEAAVQNEDEVDEDVWDAMENVDDEDESRSRVKKSRVQAAAT